MFKKFFTKKGKNFEEASYKEAEKLLLSIAHTPMKPTEKFAAALQEKLLKHFKKSQGWNGQTFMKFALKGGFAVLLLAIIGSGLYFGTGLLPGTIEAVEASGVPLPVSMPVRIPFPYDIALEDIKANFSVTPAVLGDLDFDIEKKELVFEHEKFLAYGTEYEFRIAQAASSRFAEDFTWNVTTRARFREPLYLMSRSHIAQYTANFYDQDLEVFLNVPQQGEFEVNVYDVGNADFFQFINDSQNFDWWSGDKEKVDPTKRLREELVYTGTAATEKTDQEDGKGSVELVLRPELQEHGMYFVELRGEKESEYDEGIYRFFLNYTRYAVSSKRLGGKLVHWLVDTRTGIGVPAAAVTGYNIDQKVVAQGATDADGLFEMDIKQSADYEKKPDFFIFETEDEFVPQITKAWYRDIYSQDWSNNIEGYAGYIMTDRPLYAPGDTVYFKTVVREEGKPDYNGSATTASVSAYRSLWGEINEPIFEKDFSVSSMGTFDGSFELGNELKTGPYIIRVALSENDEFTQEFGVEVYQKPEFEVSVAPEKTEYVFGQSVVANIDANFYFGAPVSNENVEVTLLSSRYYYEEPVATLTGTLDENGHFRAVFEKVKNPRQDEESYYWGLWASTYSITAKVTEASGKAITGTSQITIHPAEYEVRLEEPENIWNLRPREDVNFAFYLHKYDDEKAAVSRVPIMLNITKRKWNWQGLETNVLVENKKLVTDSLGTASFKYAFDFGGSYELRYSFADTLGNTVTRTNYLWFPDPQYGIFYDESMPAGTQQITLVTDKESYKLGETATITAYVPQNDGDLYLSINTGSIVKAWTTDISDYEVRFSVPITGELVPGFNMFAEVYNGDTFYHGTQTIEVEGKKLNVAITPSEKQLYPKESLTLDVAVTDLDGSPVASEGVISVVDKALLALRDFNELSLFDTFYHQPDSYYMNRFASSDPFLVGVAEKGGCFVGDTPILMADGTHKPISEIRVGDKILTRSDDFSKSLSEDEVVRVFEHVVESYLVINGSLKVTGIHNMFVNGLWKTADEIRVGDWLVDEQGGSVTVRSIERVTNQTKVYNFETKRLHTYFAGTFYVHNQKGDGDARPRTNFVDTAYWNAVVKTDANGRGSVRFPLPDNLTTWVALGKNITRDTQVGEGETEIVVSKGLFIRPNLPLFYRDGDTAEIAAFVQNTTDKKLTVTAKIEGTGFKVQASDTLQTTVPPHDNTMIAWMVEIDETENVALRFSVQDSSGKLVDNLHTDLPVYPAQTKHHQVISGVAPDTASFAFATDDVGSYSSAVLQLSASVAGIVPDIIEKLVGYPYGCIEQTMSKHLPNVLAVKHKELLGIELPEDIDEQLKDGLDRMQSFQQDDGSYGWWAEGEKNVWMTGYVLEGMVEMKEAGLFDRPEMYNKALDSLKNEYANLKGAERVYAAYVLSRAVPGEFPLILSDSEIGELQPQFMGYTALAHFNNGDKGAARRIAREFIKPALTDNHWEQKIDYYSMTDSFSATGLNLLAMMKIGGLNESEVKNVVKWLMDHRFGYQGLWGSTRQSMQILFALIQYIQQYDELDPDFHYAVKLNGKTIGEGDVQDELFTREINVPVSSLKNDNELMVTQEGEGSFFYTMHTINYVDADDLPKSKKAMPIKKRYLDSSGREATSFRVGDIITVEIAVDAPHDLRYVLVEDYLPAGFDVINDRIATDEFSPYYVDGKRSYYWGYPVDIRDERVAVFQDYFWDDNWNRVTYRARVAREGTYSVPSPRVEPMYDPELFGIGEAREITVAGK